MNTAYICARCRATLRSRSAKPPQTYRRDFVSFADETLEERYSNHPDQTHNEPTTRHAASSPQKLRYSGKPLPNARSKGQGRLGEFFAQTAASHSKRTQPKISRISSERIAWSSHDFRAQSSAAPTENPEDLKDVLQRAEYMAPEAIQPPTLPPLPRDFVKGKLMVLRKSPPATEVLDIMESMLVERERFNTYEWLMVKRDPCIGEQLQRLVRVITGPSPDPAMPSLARIVSSLESWGLMPPNRLQFVTTTTVRALLQEVLRKGQSPKQDEAAESVMAAEQPQSGMGKPPAQLLADLLRVWHLMSHKFLTPEQDLEHQPGDWGHLPTREGVRTILKGRRAGWEAKFIRTLTGLYNKERGHQFARDALIMLYCYRKLERLGNVEDNVQLDPFMNFLQILARDIQWTHPSAVNDKLLEAQFHSHINNEHFDIVRLIRDEFSGIDSRRKSIAGTAVVSPGEFNGLDSRTESSIAEVGVVLPQEFNIKSGKLFSDLRKATKEEDVKFLNKLWANHVELSHGRDQQYISLMYAEFLWSFVKVVQIEKAIEVWATLRHEGIKPSISHWTAMMEACKKHRDKDSLHSIWSQLQESGLEISNTAWATYLSALLHCKEWQDAVEAVQGLIDSWNLPLSEATNETAAQDFSPETEYGPSISPINATVSGLLRARKLDVADALLASVREKGIAPNVETFNIRLRAAVRKNDTERIQHILEGLHSSPCTPDVITVTILVDGLLRNRTSGFEAQSAEEQQRAIDQVFFDLDLAGISATSHTYAVILDSLLPNHRPNISAARAVLERMEQENIVVSPHIFSILVQHYFNSDPPDLWAIGQLWQKMEMKKIKADHVFFDRMVEGFAKARETETMMHFLREMPRRGKLPGWISLSLVLECLVSQQNYALANELVRDVERQEGIVKLGVRRGWRGEAEFKGYVEYLRGIGTIKPLAADAA